MSLPLQAELVDEIRRDLLAGHYSPNERLVETDLAARYEAPRAAVRIALMTLASEGLVERLPNKGAVVRSFTIEEGIEVAETRRELEALCARHAAAAATTMERGELLGIVEAMRIATERGEVETYQELSIRFHERIAEVAADQTARRFLMEIRNHRLNLHFPDAFAEANGTRDSFAEHEAVGRAIASGDEDRAEEAMRTHASSVVHLLEAFQTRRAATVNQNVDDPIDV